jgi:AraC-like DNA-binding protein
MLDRPDPITDVLSLLRVRSAITARLEAGEEWAVAFEPVPDIKFSAVLSGECWLTVDEPVRLRAGDAYLVRAGRPYRLASDPSLPPVRAAEVFGDDHVARLGAGTVLIGGGFSFDARNADLLLDALPPAVVMRDAATVRSLVELLATEANADAPALRTVTGHGWLSALADPQIGASLRLMHADVARRWTVAELAAAVAMSRSSFASRFRALVGVPPLEYLLRWRMRTAAAALEDRGRTVSSVAGELGYSSDSAFSNAFKRVMGVAPAHYRAARADRRRGIRSRGRARARRLARTLPA